MARPAVNSEQNAVLIKQDRPMGRISCFRSLWYYIGIKLYFKFVRYALFVQCHFQCVQHPQLITSSFSFPCNLLFLIFLVCMWAILERFAACHQLLDYLYYILVELSSFAVDFHELMDSKNVNPLLVDCSQWPHIHFCYISILYLICPICGGSVLRSSMQRTLLIFRLKGFIRIFVSGSHTSVIAHMLLRLFLLKFILRSVFFKPLNRFE